MFEMQDGRSASGTIARADIDVSRPIRFWKVKTFGVHTRLGYTWDVLTALPGGSRLTLMSDGPAGSATNPAPPVPSRTRSGGPAGSRIVG
jgi:hypothetical protein